MSNPTFRFIGDPEAVEALQKLAGEEKVSLSEPQPFDSTSEPLNAPLTGGEIQQAALVVSAVFASASAALLFFDRLIDLVRKIKHPIEVRKPGGGRAVVRPDTNLAKLKEAFPDV